VIMRCSRGDAEGDSVFSAPPRLRVNRSLGGAIIGALLVFAIAPYCIGWFSVPGGGIGAVTVRSIRRDSTTSSSSP